MSEKYYIVSESELEAAIAAAFADGAETERTGIISEVCKTHEAACRARPMPDWAEEFAGPVREDYDESEYYSVNRRIQRIKP